MKREKEWFNITNIHRNDLIGAGFDGDAVDDATMEHMASLMCNDYVQQLFYQQIMIYAEEFGIPKLQKKIVVHETVVLVVNGEHGKTETTCFRNLSFGDVKKKVATKQG